MSKIELNETNSGYNLQKINNNFDKIETEFNDKVLYRDNPDGEPNEMLNDLDMNGNRVFNLPAPVGENEAARLKDVQDAIANRAEARFTSFTPTPQISSTNVQVAIEEIVSDLADSSSGNGAAMVGYKVPYSGSSNINVFKKLDSLAVSPQDFWLAVDADWTSAFQRMAASGAKNIHIPAGNYVLTSDIVFNHDVTITGDGMGTVLDFSSGTGQLLIEGSLTAMSKLSANMSLHARTFSWSVAHGLVPLDVFILWNPTSYSWGSRRPYYRDGGMFRVHSVPGTTSVSTYDPCVDAYTAANFNVYKMNGVRATLSNFHAVAGGAKSPVHIRFGIDSNVDNVTTSGGDYAGIVLDRCYNTNVNVASPANNSPVVGDEYATVIANSTHVNVSGAGAFATRHAVTIGGSDETGTPPSRYVRVSNMSLLNQSSNAAAGDAHGNADYSVYDNCYFLSGASVAGRNPSIRNSEIFSTGDSPIADRLSIYATEFLGGVVSIENTNIHTSAVGQQFAFIHLTVLGPGQGGDASGTGLRDDLHLKINNVQIIAPNSSAVASAVRVDAQNANKKINVSIDGLQVVAPQLLTFLLVRDTVISQLPGDYLIVDNVYGPAGATLINPHASITNRATREMRQSGYEDVSVTSGTISATGAGINYRYKYLKSPSVSVSVSSTSGNAKQLYGGKAVAPMIYAYNVNLVTPGIVVADGTTFTSADTARLHFTASVDGV